MRWWIGGGLVLIIVGCANQPKEAQQAAYESYWRCAYAATLPYRSNHDLPPREAAMRAQAQCYPSYERYRNTKVRFVRSVVPANHHEMATTLAEQSVLERRKLVTERLAELIAEDR